MKFEEPGGVHRLVAMGVLALTGVLACVFVVRMQLSSADGQPSAAGPPPMTATPGGPSNPAELSTDPVVTARTWLFFYRTVRYTDAGPTAWEQRLEPLLAEPARTEAAGQASAGVAGASWDRFTAARCSTRVRDVGAVVPPEAPRTPTTVYVQVTGLVVTSCEAAGMAPVPDEPVSATLELRQDPGRIGWQVARRLF